MSANSFNEIWRHYSGCLFLFITQQTGSLKKMDEKRDTIQAPLRAFHLPFSTRRRLQFCTYLDSCNLRRTGSHSKTEFEKWTNIEFFTAYCHKIFDETPMIFIRVQRTYTYLTSMQQIRMSLNSSISKVSGSETACFLQSFHSFLRTIVPHHL